MVQLAYKGGVMNSFFMLLIFISLEFLLGCFAQQAAPGNNTQNVCVQGKDLQINVLKGQYVALSFYDNGEPISLFHKYDKPVDFSYQNFEFQYGKLSVFFHKAVPPINRSRFVYVFKGDTMYITIHLAYRINHFVDSIPFKKGKYEIVLDRKELYADPLYGSFMEAIHFPFQMNSVDSLYSLYTKSRGINFLNYFDSIQHNEKPPNPFLGYYYCRTLQDTKKQTSAKNYISDVLNEMYIEVKIDSIIQIE
jgi:hypothetical protein